MLSLSINIILIITLFWKYRLMERQMGDPLVIMMFFLIIYSITPVLYFFFDLKLLGLDNLPLINQNIYFLILNYLSLFYFIFLIAPIKRSSFTLNCDFIKTQKSQNTAAIFIFCYIISLSLASYYPWPKFNEDFQFGHSLVAFSKYFLLISFTKYLLEDRSHITGIALILLYSFIEGSRTFLFQSLFILLIIKQIKIRQFLIYLPLVFIFVFLLTTLTLLRAEMDLSSNEIMNGVIWVFSTETILSTYSTLQAINLQDIISNTYSPEEQFFIPFYSFSTLYINPIEYLNFIFNTNHIPFYDFEKLNPGKIGSMGGHYILAEHLFRFQYLFPFSILLEFLTYNILLLNTKKRIIKILIGSIAFMIIKSPIIVITKTIIGFIIAYYLIEKIIALE